MCPAGPELPSCATWPALIPWHPPGSGLTVCNASTVSHSYVRADLEVDEVVLANSAFVQQYVRTMEASSQFTSATVAASVFLVYAIALAVVFLLSPSYPDPLYSPHPGVLK